MIIPWTEIESFNNIRKYTAAVPGVLNGNPSVIYRAKCKQHGNNAGIQIHPDGRVIAQSRTTELTSQNDLAGFAKWVASLSERLLTSEANGYILYGEWCGPGIQSGVAINKIGQKIFAVFAARSLDLEDDNLIVEPSDLEKMIACTGSNTPLSTYGIFVLPWHKDPIEVDWSSDDANLGSKTALINEWVTAVEKNDPWVESVFGVKGTGEGLVLYPVSHPGYKNYCNLVFKAKGSLHKMIKNALPAQVNPGVAESANLFAEMVLTIARLEQGARAVSEDGNLIFSHRSIGKFLNWIAADVQKESQDELEASGLEWKQVQKLVSDKARNWYLSKEKK